MIVSAVLKTVFTVIVGLIVFAVAYMGCNNRDRYDK